MVTVSVAFAGCTESAPSAAQDTAAGNGSGDSPPETVILPAPTNQTGTLPNVTVEASRQNVVVSQLALKMSGAAGDSVFVWVPLENLLLEERVSAAYSVAAAAGEASMLDMLWVSPTLAMWTNDGGLDPSFFSVRTTTGSSFESEAERTFTIDDNQTAGVFAFFAAATSWTFDLVVRTEPSIANATQSPFTALGQPVIARGAGMAVHEYAGPVPILEAEPAGHWVLTEEVEQPSWVHVASSMATAPAGAAVRQSKATYPGGHVEESTQVCVLAVVIGLCTGGTPNGGELSSATGTFTLEMTHVEPSTGFHIRVFEIPLDLSVLPDGWDGFWY